jgi:Tfp pilus assembly protein PilF
VPPVPQPQPAATEPPSAVPPPAGAEREAVLAEAGRLANVDRCAEALEVCQRHEEEAGPSAAVCFMMGMLHQSAGDLDRAEGCLHKTLYLDAANEEALLALALLARQRGDTRMADTYRQSAARAFARKSSS